jgi:tRNA dimethylallyltransferase
MTNKRQLLRCIGLAGPTASGKTAAALQLAEALNGEIISVDSALVYRGMDVGTAKPTPDERARVPHHLIDIRNPDQPYSAAEFVADARAAMADIIGRGRVPVLTGGTMLYFKALVEGLDALPAADPGTRAALQVALERDGIGVLHARLAELDPVTAQRLAPADTQRVLRALEVYMLTGEPLSQFHTRSPESVAQCTCTLTDSTKMIAIDAYPECAIMLFSLVPQDREWLHQRIHDRFNDMLRDGLVGEVQGLRADLALNPDLPSLRSVGYRQTWAALDAWGIARTTTALDTATQAQVMQQVRLTGTAATRQLAKRQLTWLRSLSWSNPVACDQPDTLHALTARVRRSLQAEVATP